MSWEPPFLGTSGGFIVPKRSWTDDVNGAGREGALADHIREFPFFDDILSAYST